MRSSLRLIVAALAVTISLCATAGTALAAPTNDNFADAQQLTGNQGSTPFDLADATAEASEAFSGGALTRSVWFRYSPTASGFASFFNCNSDTGLEVEGSSIVVYKGATLAGLTSESGPPGGCSNDRVNSQTPTFAVQSGEDYWVQLATTETNTITAGSLRYDFNTAVPSNDNLADAQTIGPTLPQTLDADNGLASIEPNEPNTETWGPAGSLWYSWTPDQDGTVSIDTCSTSWSNADHAVDSRIHIYTAAGPAPALADLQYEGESDDSCPDPNALLSHAYLTVSTGTTYFIRVANYADEYGFDYKLNLRWVGSPEVSRPPYIYPNNTRLGVGDTVYAYTSDWAAYPGITEVSVAWKRCDAAGDNCALLGGETNYSYVVAAADVGHTLRISVTGTNGVESLSVESPPSPLVDDTPANDNFADAADLGATAPTSVADDNYLATYEDGENNDATAPVDHSVWYRWTAPESKTYFVDSCQSASAPNFAVNVYIDAGLGISELAANNGANNSCDDAGKGAGTFFAANAGSSYFIQAGSSAGQGPMEFTLTIHQVPAPSFATSPTLTGAALEHSTLSLAAESETSVINTVEEIFWTLCDSAGANCTDLAEITTGDALLTTEMIGKRIRATVTYTNANGSVSESVLSPVIEPDTDSDGLTDADDTCPTEAGARANGCPPSEIVNNASPTITGSTIVGQQLTSSTGDWTVNHDPLGYALAYRWQRCATASTSTCSDIAGATNTSYSLLAADKGNFIRVVVVATNDDDEVIQPSGLTAAISDPSVTPPVTPPAPSNPLTLAVKKSLGSLTPKKGVITIKGAIVTCAASATGPCTGTVTLSATKGKRLTKFVSAKIAVAPGKSGPVTIKLKSAQLKALKKARSLKVTAAFSVTGPGFAPSTATATATLKPQK